MPPRGPGVVREATAVRNASGGLDMIIPEVVLSTK